MQIKNNLNNSNNAENVTQDSLVEKSKANLDIPVNNDKKATSFVVSFSSPIQKALHEFLQKRRDQLQKVIECGKILIKNGMQSLSNPSRKPIAKNQSIDKNNQRNI